MEICDVLGPDPPGGNPDFLGGGSDPPSGNLDLLGGGSTPPSSYADLLGGGSGVFLSGPPPLEAKCGCPCRDMCDLDTFFCFGLDGFDFRPIR